jgi:hypothetical protein
MRIFYTGSDIEDLAARGLRQLELGPGVTLTDTARERAEELRIALVVPGNVPTSKAAAPTAAAPAAKGGSLPPRPKGCQHGSITAKVSRAEPASTGGPVIEQLVEAVSALKKRGG